jgi:DNA-binding CsgD family transcriptional regulator
MELLERERYLSDLAEWLQGSAKSGGCIVLLRGEAGIGKTSLLQEFSNRQRGTRVLWGACDALFTPLPLAPLHDIARQTQGALLAAVNSGGNRDAIFAAALDELERGEDALVVFEDMHWADEATLDLLKFLGRRIHRTRAMLAVTYRDDEVGPRHPLRFVIGDLPRAATRRMSLSPLSEPAVLELARLAGRPAKGLHGITGGNPFFVREALASLDERVPETVRDAVLARLVRCSPAARELAELVSISPSRTEAWLVEHVLGSYLAAVDEAVDRGLLVMQSDSVGYRHELARLAVLSTIPQERLRPLHNRVLQALVEHGSDLSQLVHHATLADSAAAVLEYAPRAAKEAARVGAHREAAAHLSAALGYSNVLPMEVQADLLEQHALECSLGNQTRQAITSAVAAVSAWRQVGNIVAQARILSFLPQEYRTVGEKERADECVATAIDLLEALPPSANLAMAYSARSLLAANRGWDKEALEFGRRALAVAREFGDHARQAQALCDVGAALCSIGDHAGFEFLEQSLALATEHQLEASVALAYRNKVFYAVLLHDFDQAQRAFREAIAYCEERGIFSHSAYISAYYTPCELDQGNWDEATRIAGALLQSSEITGVQQRISVLTTLALVRVRRGDPDSGPPLDEALALALPTSELNRIGRVTAARAERAWLGGDIDHVAREAALGLEYVGGHTAPWIRGELLFWLSRAQKIDSIPDDIAEPYRLMLQGRWRDAANAWESVGMPYEQALALAEGPEKAQREALTILDRLGAVPLAGIVRRRLRERGARGVPRGSRTSTVRNPLGLTQREAEVLGLLAKGLRNSAIAKRLFLSTKTVDHHVSAVLTKLGVPSRAEAVAMAHRQAGESG